jgi:hypothetical protein
MPGRRFDWARDPKASQAVNDAFRRLSQLFNSELALEDTSFVGLQTADALWPTTLSGYGITDAASDAELAAHAVDTTAVHGIADTSLLIAHDGAGNVALSGSLTALSGSVSTQAVIANDVGVYNDPEFPGFPNVSFQGGVSGVLFGSGAAPGDVRVGRTSAGVFKASIGIIDADKLGGQTSAYHLDRANHTGTQAAGTITGLATVATSGSASDLGTGNLPAARLPVGSSSVVVWDAGAGSTHQVVRLIELTAGVVVGATSGVQGAIAPGGANGLGIHGRTGSTNDLTFLTPAGAVVFRVPTGTTTLTTNAGLSVGTTLALPGIATATTVGAAGGAAALPATPTGYITVSIGGTNRKIPYYAT